MARAKENIESSKPLASNYAAPKDLQFKCLKSSIEASKTEILQLTSKLTKPHGDIEYVNK